jgi:hypothetical protein
MTPKTDAAQDHELDQVRRHKEAWAGAWDDALPLRKLMHNLQAPEFVDALAAEPDAAAAPVRVNLDLPMKPEKLANPLAELQGLHFMTQIIERTKVEVVAACRRDGRSWAQIGDALGVTRQSAWMKYGADEADAAR